MVEAADKDFLRGSNAASITTAVLSWVAGYVDTAGFLSLNGLFTAHVTGNLVVAGAEIAGAGGEAVWVRLAVIPVFIAAVALTTVIARSRHPRTSNFLWFEAITLLIFTAASVTLIPKVDRVIDPLPMFIAGSTGVFAMGIQNALMREVLSNLAPTTVMTGNLTQLTVDSVRLLWIRDYREFVDRDTQQREIRNRIGKFGITLGSFVFGAALGALVTRAIGFWSILIAAGAIAWLALDARRRETALARTS